MTQQDFARMTAVIDGMLERARLAQVTRGTIYQIMAAAHEADAYEEAAADLLEALPVPEDE